MTTKFIELFVNDPDYPDGDGNLLLVNCSAIVSVHEAFDRDMPELQDAEEGSSFPVYCIIELSNGTKYRIVDSDDMDYIAVVALIEEAFASDEVLSQDARESAAAHHSREKARRKRREEARRKRAENQSST